MVRSGCCLCSDHYSVSDYCNADFKTAGGSAPPNAYLSLATREKIM